LPATSIAATPSGSSADADAAGAAPSPTAFAARANFSTGLLAQSDWGAAQWIIGGALFRHAFEIADTDAINSAGAITRVSLFVSACQYYVLYLDGIRIGDHELDVVWTKFAENRSYATYSLDPALLAPGKHALGMMVGQGFCGSHEGTVLIVERFCALEDAFGRALLKASP
jgi:alpha-L-rhamnosidase